MVIANLWNTISQKWMEREYTKFLLGLFMPALLNLAIFVLVWQESVLCGLRQSLDGCTKEVRRCSKNFRLQMEYDSQNTLPETVLLLTQPHFVRQLKVLVGQSFQIEHNMLG